MMLFSIKIHWYYILCISKYISCASKQCQQWFYIASYEGVRNCVQCPIILRKRERALQSRFVQGIQQDFMFTDLKKNFWWSYEIFSDTLPPLGLSVVHQALAKKVCICVFYWIWIYRYQKSKQTTDVAFQKTSFQYVSLKSWPHTAFYLTNKKHGYI